MSKLAWHMQQIAHGDLVNSEFVKVIDPPQQNPFRDCKVIGRTFMPDEESNALVWRGAQGAREWFARWQRFYLERPWAWAWEGPNEPHPMADQGFRWKLDEFTCELAELMSAINKLLVAHNWSVGWSDKGHAPDFRESMMLLSALDHYLGLHEYSAPAMWDTENGYLTLRYRRTFRELSDATIPIPDVLIGECGIDGGVYTVGRPKTGWKTYITPNESEPAPAVRFMEQLAWYDGELHKDPEVIAAFVFTSGPYPDWWDFDVNREVSELMHRHIETFTPPVVRRPRPVVKPEKPEEPEPKAQPDYDNRVVVELTDKIKVRKKPTKVVIHHSAGEQRPKKPIRKYIKQLARIHVKRNHWSCLAYDYIFAANGDCYHVGSDQIVSYHAGDWQTNYDSIAFCFLGMEPTAEQLDMMRWMVGELKVSEVVPHSSVVATACPGNWKKWGNVLEEAVIPSHS